MVFREMMENQEVVDIALEVLESLIDTATGQAALKESPKDLSSPKGSQIDLREYESRCIVDISDDDPWGDGEHILKEEDSSLLYDDIPISDNPIDWKLIMNSKQSSYITHWNFFPESSENLLNLQPHEMCENWDADEDKRRKVYWASGGLIQERYIRTLFREPDTPDEARPTLARVSSEELISGAVPHVSAIVASRRLPSGVSRFPAAFRRRPMETQEEKEVVDHRRKPLMKKLSSSLSKTLSRAR